MPEDPYKGRRPPAHVCEERHRYVEDLLVVCTPRAQILDLATDQFGVTRETVDDWIDKVRKRWAVESEAKRPHVRAILQAKIEHQQFIATMNDDRKSMIDLLKLELELHGLRSRTLTHVAGEMTPAAAMTPEQRRTEIDRLLQKRAEAEMAAATKH